MTPLFSIITISYNSVSTIERTIDSIRTQSLKDYEYIIIDGGSTDGTIDVIKRNEKLFEGRLKWISEPDNGIYNAMNKGIAAASGNVIGIVNSDDWLECNALELVRACIQDNHIDATTPFLITGEMRFHSDSGSSIVMRTCPKRYEKYAKVYRMGLNHPATFVSRAVYNSIGSFDENLRLYGDADLIIRCYQNRIPIYFLNEVLSNMADGGASNVRKLGIHKDDYYILRKYCSSTFEYVYRLYIRKAQALIKAFMGTYVQKYRQYINK